MGQRECPWVPEALVTLIPPSYSSCRLTRVPENVFETEAYYLLCWQGGGGVELAAHLCRVEAEWFGTHQSTSGLVSYL